MRGAGTMVATILVVDDNPDVCEVIEGALQDAGYAVQIACGPAEAMELASTVAIDIAVVDICLRAPTSGIELASYLAERGVAIILSSGDPVVIANRGQLQHVLLAKPFRLHELVAAVAEAAATAESPAGPR